MSRFLHFCILICFLTFRHYLLDPSAVYPTSRQKRARLFRLALGYDLFNVLFWLFGCLIV